MKQDVFSIAGIGGARVSVSFESLEEKPSAFLLQSLEWAPKRALRGAVDGW